jgi:hypothetical protein
MISAIILMAALAMPEADESGESVFESRADLTPQGKIDELVFGRLKRLRIQPAGVCSDSVFVRRVYLDVIGTLPAAQEAREFLADQDPNKRRALIDRLLAREEFADYWAMKWSDLLRVKAEFPINLWPNAAQMYYRWIRAGIRDNLPYDRFVREMLVANGSNFRVPQVNFYRAIQVRKPPTIAQAVALTFMGVRAEKWPKERLAGMAAFFSQIGYKSTGEWKEEIVYFDPTQAAAQTGNPVPDTAVFPDGTSVKLPPGRDPRAVFADWLMAPQNPWFARNIVNRVWSWLLGRGIIHEPDDIRENNPPSHAELLAYLEQELVAARYDLKHIYRLILNSKTYQLSSIPKTDTPQAAAQFAHYPLRRLEAEVLIDALCQITGTTERYSSIIPEPFTYIPENQRSIALPDGSITSSFLEQFGRPSRDTGFESERNSRPTAEQRLHLLNSSHIRRKIEQGPNLQALMQSGAEPREVANVLYLTILSRFPTEEEWAIVKAYAKTRGEGELEYVAKPSAKPGKPEKAKPSTTSRKEEADKAKSRPQPQRVRGSGTLMDLAWALINSTEFLCRH